MDLFLIGALDLVIGFLTVAYFNYWKSYLFDPQFVETLGVRTFYLECILYVMIAMAIVILIKVVGIILIIIP